MRTKLQTKVASAIAVNYVVVKLHALKVAVGVAIKIIKHDSAKSAILQLKNNIIRHVAVSAAA